jgi:hypothetical protein
MSMKSITKRIGLMTIAMLAALAMPALADVGVIDMGVTNKFTANYTTTANMGNSVKLTKNDTVGVQVAVQGDAAGTGAITATFARSLDGTTWETAPRFTMACALNGTTAVVQYTNFPNTIIGPVGYIKLISVQNADATANATNASIKIITKTLKPSP